MCRGTDFREFLFFPPISSKAHASQSDREEGNVGGENGVEGGGGGKGSQEKGGAVAEQAATVMMEVGEGCTECGGVGGGVEKVGGRGKGVGQVGGGEERAMGEGDVSDGMRAGVGKDVQVVGAEGAEGGKVREGEGGGGGGRGRGEVLGGGEGGCGGEDVAAVWGVGGGGWGVGGETSEDVQGRHAKRYMLPCSYDTCILLLV